jgi:hypothetical protein
VAVDSAGLQVEMNFHGLQCSNREPCFESEPIPKPEGVEGRDWTW